MKRKLAVVCIMALSTTAILAGCGGSGDGGSDSGKTQIRFATWDVAEDVDKQQELVDKFNEEHDDIEVTLERTEVISIPRSVPEWDPEIHQMLCTCGITRLTTMDWSRLTTTSQKRATSTNPTSMTHSGITT